MKKLLLFCLFIVIVLWGTSAGATFSSEVIAYPGPPNYEDLHDYGARPSQIGVTGPNKSVDVHVGWWSMGTDITTTWDKNFQGWVNTWAHFEKEFEVTGAGAAAINFSFNGFLQVVGSTAQTGNYYSGVWANIWDVWDGNSDQYNWEYWYLDGPGRMDFSEEYTFDYFFEEDDIGQTFMVKMDFDFEITPYLYLIIRQRETGQDPLAFADGESLDFISSFQNGLKIDSISGGIAAVDGPDLPSPVPVPSAIWLLSIAMAVVFAIKKRL